MAIALPNVKHVERMVRKRTLANLPLDERESLLAEPFFETEPLRKMPMELALINMLEKLVSDPVCLDNALVEGIGDTIGVRDVREIGVHRLEFRENLFETIINRPVVEIPLHLAALIRPAIMEAVRPESVSRTTEYPVHMGNGTEVLRKWVEIDSSVTGGYARDEDDLFIFTLLGEPMLTHDAIDIPQRAFPKVRDAKVGDRNSWSKRFDTRHTELTGEATGDKNPIHFDKQYAALTRFKEPIIHGASIVGEISRVLGMEFPGRGTVWMQECTLFKGPIYHGQTVYFVAEIIETFPEKERLVIRTIGTVNDRIVVENVSTIFLGPDPLAEI